MKTVYRGVLFALLTMMLLMESTLSAQIISPNNPYRSFNIHGINYGSQRWEQQHAQKRVVQPRTQPLIRSCRRRR